MHAARVPRFDWPPQRYIYRFSWVFVLCLSALAYAQKSGGDLTIRVDTNRVLIPVIVGMKDEITTTFGTQRHSSAIGLGREDFRILEDGKEQVIRSVVMQLGVAFDFVDNLGVHSESFDRSPVGKWLSPNRVSRQGIFRDSYPYYLLSYAPPDSPEGTCHNVAVKVNNKDLVTFARTEYCTTAHSSIDTLNGTQLSKEMERLLDSEEVTKIASSVQAPFFYEADGRARVHVAFEFDSDSLKRKVRGNELEITLGVLGTVSRRDGTVVARFSDSAFDEGETSLPDNANLDVYIPLVIPNRYETQMKIAPGEYELRVVITDGATFGRAHTPLIVDAYDPGSLAISGVALAKQYRKAEPPISEGESLCMELLGDIASSKGRKLSKYGRERCQQRDRYGAGLTESLCVRAHDPDGRKLRDTIAPCSQYLNVSPVNSDFVPLVSKGIEFTPTADSRFNGKQDAMIYFEVYEPLLRDSKPADLQFRMRITNAKTGTTRMDTGTMSAAPWVRPGSSVVPIAVKLAIGQLSTGTYTLEVQAMDSLGRTTAWRKTEFTIQ